MGYLPSDNDGVHVLLGHCFQQQPVILEYIQGYFHVRDVQQRQLIQPEYLCVGKNFAYKDALNIFKEAGCALPLNPEQLKKGPFCAWYCQ